MSDFKQTESITRRLTGAVLVTSLLFLMSAIGVYLFSRSSLDGLASLARLNQVYDLTRQASQIAQAQAEIMRRPSSSDHQALARFRVAGEQTERLYGRALELIRDEPEVRRLLAESQKATAAYRKAATEVLAGTVEFERGKLMASQFEIELMDVLARTQIALRARSEGTFEAIYAERFHPLAAGVAFAVLFTGVSLAMGFALRRRINRSIENLVSATRRVAAGELGFRAPVIWPDEIGLVTDAFNSMTEALRSSTYSRSYLENIIESMRNSVLVLDSEGTIRQANDVVRRVFGFAKSELVGRPWASVFGSELAVTAAAFHERVLLPAKDGRKIPVSLSITPLKEAGVGEFVCVVEDITERVAAETELQARHIELVSTNKELEAFSYSVSHDLRAPLRGIDGFSQALVEDLGENLDAASKDSLQRIRAGVQKMGHLIDDLLELSKLTRKEMNIGRIDMAPIARSVIEDIRARDPAREVEWKIADDLVVDGDPGLIAILLENLLGNAWKYSTKVARARVEFGVERREDETVFFVRDNGAGFDMTYSGRLFGAFQRLHSEADFPGTGVGLATVQRIVRRHGGRVWAEGKVGAGATFFFSIPPRAWGISPETARAALPVEKSS